MNARTLLLDVDTAEMSLMLEIFSRYTEDSDELWQCLDERFPGGEGSMEVTIDPYGTMRVTPSAAFLSFIQDLL